MQNKSGMGEARSGIGGMGMSENKCYTLRIFYILVKNKFQINVHIIMILEW